MIDDQDEMDQTPWLPYTPRPGGLPISTDPCPVAHAQNTPTTKPLGEDYKSCYYCGMANYPEATQCMICKRKL